MVIAKSGLFTNDRLEILPQRKTLNKYMHKIGQRHNNNSIFIDLIKHYFWLELLTTKKNIRKRSRKCSFDQTIVKNRLRFFTYCVIYSIYEPCLKDGRDFSGLVILACKFYIMMVTWLKYSLLTWSCLYGGFLCLSPEYLFDHCFFVLPFMLILWYKYGFNINCIHTLLK